MKKNLIPLLAFVPLAFADVLIEDFEKDDRVSLLSEKDVWFIYTDSADVGCTTYFDFDEEKIMFKEYEEPCSVINTIYYDGLFSNWSFEPRKFSYENEDGEYVDTTMYFPLRTTSPFTAKDRQEEGPAVQTLAVNETMVGGFYYEFGDSQLMLRATPNGYNIAEPNYWFVPYVAMGLKTNGNGTEYDLSKCKGISYKYRGEGHRFRADISTVYDNNYHAIKVNPSYALSNQAYGGSTRTVQGYSTVTILWSQLAQESWGARKAFDATKIKQLVWELKGSNYNDVDYDPSSPGLWGQLIPGISSDFGDLVIDDVTCLTIVSSDTEIPVGPSSSSVMPASSSSVTEAVQTNVAKSHVSIQVQDDGLAVQVRTPAKVMFFDQQGRTIGNIIDVNAGSSFVSFDGLSRGMYIAVLKTEGTSQSMKVLVK